MEAERERPDDGRWCFSCGKVKADDCFSVREGLCDDCWDNREDVKPEEKMADESEWPDSMVERLREDIRQSAEILLTYTEVCEILDTLASDPEALKALPGEPTVWYNPDSLYPVTTTEPKHYTENWVPLYAITEETSPDE